MIGRDDPRHGTTRGYNSGCHEACCRAAMTKREKYLKLMRHRGTPASVPACGAQRRIQALMWQGWSATEIAHAAGWNHRNSLHRILKGQKGKPTRWLERKTHDAVVTAFRELWAKTPTSRYANRTAAQARARGYLSALAWDDLDDPDEVPAEEYQPIGPVLDPVTKKFEWPDEPVDESAVERILRGDWRLKCTKADKFAVVARFTGDLNDLSRLTGWKAERYVTRDPEAAA